MMATQDADAALLTSSLAGQRKHVLGILDGLDDEALRRPVLPSGWSCLGLVQHLTLDVEKFWFAGVVAGDETVVADLQGNSENAWDIGPDVSATSVVASYRQEIERADAIIATTPLDAAPHWWPRDLFGDWRMDSLREVILHVITETAVHAGHLDAARELVDGRLWLVLTDDEG